jgi:hypothetical protein
MEGTCVESEKTGDATGMATPHYPTVIPLTRIKLVGASNYLIWAKQSLMNLKARGLHKYVTEESKKSGTVEDSKRDLDDNVVSLLLTNAMDDAILPQFILYESAKEIWDAALFMYSQKENKARDFELHTRAWNLRQGCLSATGYYNEISKIWQQIDFVMSCVAKCSECAEIVSKRENQIRAYKFLNGLNSEFDQIRQQLTQKEPSVTPMEAFMVVVHEESRQKLMAPTIVKGAVAAVVIAKNAQPTPIERMCDYCHKKGHIRDTCWDLHGRPSGGRGRIGHGSGRRGGGRNGGLVRTQQAYASYKAPDDRASQPVHLSPLWRIW